MDINYVAKVNDNLETELANVNKKDTSFLVDYAQSFKSWEENNLPKSMIDNLLKSRQISLESLQINDLGYNLISDLRIVNADLTDSYFDLYLIGVPSTQSVELQEIGRALFVKLQEVIENDFSSNQLYGSVHH